VLGGEVVELEQFLPLLGDLRDGLGELGTVGIRERLDRLIGEAAVLGVVDLLHGLRRAVLRGLGQAVAQGGISTWTPAGGVAESHRIDDTVSTGSRCRCYESSAARFRAEEAPRPPWTPGRYW
jgi:hypothetical protein